MYNLLVIDFINGNIHGRPRKKISCSFVFVLIIDFAHMFKSYFTGTGTVWHNMNTKKKIIRNMIWP